MLQSSNEQVFVLFGHIVDIRFDAVQHWCLPLETVNGRAMSVILTAGKNSWSKVHDAEKKGKKKSR